MTPENIKELEFALSQFILAILAGMDTPEEELQNLRRVSNWDSEELVWEQ